MEPESVFFYVLCARPTRLCKPELNLLKSGKKTLFNYAIGNTMTRRGCHGRIQKAWKHSTIPTRLCKPELNLLKSGKKTLFNYAIENTMTRGRHGQIQKARKHGTIQHTENLARYKSNIQTALTTQNAWKHSRIKKPYIKALKPRTI